METEQLLALLPASPANNVSANANDNAGPSSPSRNGWHHRPNSPSPLSPHKARSPRPVASAKKRTKAPLSRLVLEKAVRQKGKDTATALELERLGSSVLSEGGRRGNEARPRPKPVSNSAPGQKTPSLGSSLSRSTLKSSANLAAQPAGPGQSREIRESLHGRDMTKVDGLGPKAALKGSKVWR